MPPKRQTPYQSRNLTYDAGPVPPFLQRLHNQVKGSNVSSKGNNADEISDFDALLHTDGVPLLQQQHAEVGGHGKGVDKDEAEELDGAQVVVLKEGKHLNREEAIAAQRRGDGEPQSIQKVTVAGPGMPVRKQQSGSISHEVVEDKDDERADLTASSQRSAKRTKLDIPQSVSSASKHKRGTYASSMADAKELIAAKKAANDDTKAVKTQRREEERQKKKQRVKEEKKKSGKRLSFAFED